MREEFGYRDAPHLLMRDYLFRHKLMDSIDSKEIK